MEDNRCAVRQSKKAKIKENSELKPINPYGNTKLVVENFLNDLFKSEVNNWAYFLFLATITLTVISHQKFHMPTTFGMITGLGVLSLFGFYLKKTCKAGETRFDIFTQVGKAEWDTLLFFYGVLMCVGGLSAFGYLAYTAEVTYIDLGPTIANVLVGILSAIVDNIPVMYAVLTMFPGMDEGQWLLATLTAGVGGSMLSIGSAAGVALMGQSKGNYTFFGHLKWTPVIALGYAASIYIHLIYNADKFDNIPIVL